MTECVQKGLFALACKAEEVTHCHIRRRFVPLVSAPIKPTKELTGLTQIIISKDKMCVRCNTKC